MNIKLSAKPLAAYHVYQAAGKTCILSVAAELEISLIPIIKNANNANIMQNYQLNCIYKIKCATKIKIQ